MCFLPMVINTDGIKPNGVGLSACSVRYSLLAMIRLLRCSYSPAIYDTSSHAYAGPFGRTAPIGHVETDRSTGRLHRLTCQGREGFHERFAEPTARRSSTHPFRSSLDGKIVRYSPHNHSGCPYSSLPSFRNGQTHWPNILVRSLRLRFRPDQRRLVGHYAGPNNVGP